jgi:hypothetical protein
VTAGSGRLFGFWVPRLILDWGLARLLRLFSGLMLVSRSVPVPAAAAHSHPVGVAAAVHGDHRYERAADQQEEDKCPGAHAAASFSDGHGPACAEVAKKR